ncbi:MAG: threonine--tRNA ligase, partial [Desulfobulbaceae bacterium]|nr:threonine--tRNA ligase [Desulfobulbaceae bacterium]
MNEISITFNNEETKTFTSGTTIAEAIKAFVSKKQRQNIIAASLNGKAVDLSTRLTVNADLTPINGDSDEGLEILRHSSAHIMAQAVRELFGPAIKIAIGPSIDDGFYYDFDVEKPFSSEDFQAIEDKMAQIIAASLPFNRSEMSKDEAIELFSKAGEDYKVELLREMESDMVSIYQQGDFTDLCRGPHIPDTSWLQAYKILRVAGAYWRGDENNTILQRLYGTSYPDKKQLKLHLDRLEEAKKRDHRRLGKELCLFTIQDEIGPGLILWQPKGSLLRHLIEEYWKEQHYRNGYDLLYTPHIARQDLWKTSGHLDFYGENMYSPMEIDEVKYQLKPMNCPFHIGVYSSRKHSYREFPIRWCELGTVYRYERTGALHGLMRVRGFTQDDAHIFCRRDQLQDEIYNIIDLNLHILKTFGFSDYDIYLSTRPEKYVGSDENWELATDALRQA